MVFKNLIFLPFKNFKKRGGVHPTHSTNHVYSTNHVPPLHTLSTSFHQPCKKSSPTKASYEAPARKGKRFD